MAHERKFHQAYQLPPLAGRTSIQSPGSLKSVPTPSPKATEVLIKVRAVSLNYRDLAISDGSYPRALPDHAVVPVSDLAGEIASHGDEVTGWKVGEAVCSNFSTHWLDGDANPAVNETSLGGVRDGGLQEYVAIPAQALVRSPKGYTFAEASTLPCAALTAYNALYGPSGRPLKPGDTVVVEGTGGVSLWALQISRAAGAEVIVTSSSDDKLEMAKKLGANWGINYVKDKEWGEKVWEITQGRGADHVIEAAGSPSTVTNAFKAVRMGGVISAIGFVGGSSGDFPNVTALAMSKGAVLRGVLTGSVRQLEELVRVINANGIKPVIDRVFKFEEALEAYKYLKSGQHVGKVVIEVV